MHPGIHMPSAGASPRGDVAIGTVSLAVHTSLPVAFAKHCVVFVSVGTTIRYHTVTEGYFWPSAAALQYCAALLVH